MRRPGPPSPATSLQYASGTWGGGRRWGGGGSGVGGGRYRLLSPVRAYAAARAAESSDLAAVRKRHVDWVAELAWASWEAGQGLHDRRELEELRDLLPDAPVALGR